MFLWGHRLLLLGRGFVAGLHRHHAAQLCWAMNGRIRVRPSSGSIWWEAAGFFVPADQTHELDADGVEVAILYLDGQSTEYADYVRVMGYSKIGITELSPPTAARPLRQLLESGGSCTQAEEVVQLLLGLSDSAGSSTDRRIVRALEWIDANLGGPIRIATLASAAGLSESHFAHLFVQSTGVPVRRYVLWRRLRAAVAAATSGASLTVAAHAAGLADSSHLTRAFRATFGVAPSFLFQHRALLDGQLCDFERIPNRR